MTTTEAHAEAVRPRRRRRPVSSLIVPAIGLTLVGFVVAWLAVNLFKDWSTFVQLSFSGLTRGSLYALVALGYTLVYGILELINFAHGDVFMIGGMIAATFAIQVFDLELASVDVVARCRRSSSRWPSRWSGAASSTRRSSGSRTSRYEERPGSCP